VENFNSSQWGHGTSKVIAQHYNTVQQGRKLDKLEGRDKAGSNEDGSRKLTPEDFKELISVLQQSRQLKKSAKHQGAYIDIQRKELEVLVSSERDEVSELEKLCKKLQAQIDEEQARLRDVEEKRQKDLDFVENAFYTSNEEGMGVSPNSYEGQNRMPRPGHRVKTPPKDVPMTDPLSDLEKSLDKIMPNHRVVKKSDKSQKSQKS